MIQRLMQDVPLTLNLVRERVERLYADKTVTTRYADAIDRETIGELLAHAGDSVLFVDRSLVGALAGLAAPTALRHVVVMDDRTSEGARDVAPFGALDSLRHYVERDLRILQMTIVRNLGNVLACPTVSNPKSPVSSPSTTCWPGDR